MKSITRILLIVIGSISVVLGVIGIVLPLLPTTPFLLLAASCYFKSSERFYEWLLGNRYLGDYIRNYREGRGIPLKTKILAISLLWLTISYSAIFIVPILSVKALLFLIAIGVTIHLLNIKTLER